ncbi:hypothetical protein RCL1_008455 [Eukaryota sp. TZLM3-RCL]
MPPQLTIISPEDLANEFRLKTKRILVFDVRSYDYQTARLPHSVNIPIDDFVDRVGSLVDIVTGVDLVVFHCHYCQERGPKAAKLFLQHFQRKFPRSSLRIAILEGGFKCWHNAFSQDEDLCLPVITD